jgi:hypothetical protein
MRHCASCNTLKSLDEFHNDKNRPLGKSYRCKLCGTRHREKNRLFNSYGITYKEYGEMFKSQCGLCAICQRADTGVERTKNFSIDHCHSTGEVRGLLCNWCNQGLGHFRDSPELLTKAVEYLLKTKE